MTRLPADSSLARMKTTISAFTRIFAYFALLLTANAVVFAQDSSENIEQKVNLFVFVFKEGVAQKSIDVQVDDVKVRTDKFGAARFALPSGEHEVGYLNNGELFALTDVTLLESVSSQIFLNLTKKGADVELDLPLSAYEQNFEKESLKEQTGPKGTLRIIAKDTATQDIISGGKLFFKGYAIDAITDENGIAEIELSEGSYDISVVHPKYVMQVLKDIKVKADDVFETTAMMIKADIVLDEFVVSAPFVEGSLASNIAVLKESDVVGDAISSEQFSKAGDSSAAGALKRVTGITIVDDKYVFVRGLGERYSTVLLNGLEVPSPEPTKRVVPLDIFPTGVIQSMDIQKTYSSNLPGTFGGGTIIINTKDIPKEDNYLKASIGLKYRDSTGDEAVIGADNDIGLPDYLINLTNGFTTLDDEIRLGNVVLTEGLSAEERAALDSAMVNYRSYSTKKKKIAPGGNISLSAGQSFKTDSGIKYGFAGNIYYKTDEDQQTVGEVSPQVQGSDGLGVKNDRAFSNVKSSEKYGGLVSFGLEPSESFKLKYTYVGLVDTEDQTKIANEYDYIQEEGNLSYLYRYTEEELSSHQLGGELDIPLSYFIGDDSWIRDAEINWAYSVAEASRFEPGTVEYEYKETLSTDSRYIIDPEKTFYQYSDMQDDTDSFRFDLNLPYKIAGAEGRLTVGYYQLDKERSLDNRRFRALYTVNDDNRDPNDRDTIEDLMQTNLALTDTLDFKDVYKQADFYTAELALDAFYVDFLLTPHSAFDINVGARNESAEQTLIVGIETSNLERFTSNTDDVLPFLGATYRLNDEHQFRFGYSQTLTRPDFRESSPNRYKDTETDKIVYGHPDLKYTEITNIDFKYEWFPSFDEFFSIGVFTKDFVNPIETVRESVDEDYEVSYRNAEGAKSYGLELGFRKNLNGVAQWLDNYFIEGNYAYIQSEVELNKDNPKYANDRFISEQTSVDRPMQGQSPYVANLKIGYDNFFTKRSAMFLYNVYGKRIDTIGIDGEPDVYEQPFHRLDFVVKWGLNDTYDDQVKKIGYELTLKLKNLLDSEVEKTMGNIVTEKIKKGRSVDLGISMKF